MNGRNHPRIVLVHDWLTGIRGGEKCLEVFCQRWPDAELFTLLHRVGSVSTGIERLPISTSFLQRFPAVHRYYRYLLPLMPLAASRWRLPACDLVVSLSHCVAKAAKPPQGVPHVCYCFTPMRYAWHMRDAYFQAGSSNSFQGPAGGLGVRGLSKLLSHSLLNRLRDWDRRTAERVTHFIAISRTVQRRIARCYGRPSVVIYPPVDTDFYSPAALAREDFYLVVSAFAPYKRLDLAIAACNRMRRKLVVIGTGQDSARLRSLAGPTVQLLGWQSDDVIRDHMRRCRALLFPGEEDFGIVPLEAHACGTPVIAFGRGGATETVIPLNAVGSGQWAVGSMKGVQEHEGDSADQLSTACWRPPATGLLPTAHCPLPTGVWFEEQTEECLAAAIETFERRLSDFNPDAARRQAERFNPRRFANELFAYLDAVLQVGRLSVPRAA